MGDSPTVVTSNLSAPHRLVSLYTRAPVGFFYMHVQNPVSHCPCSPGRPHFPTLGRVFWANFHRGTWQGCEDLPRLRRPGDPRGRWLYDLPGRPGKRCG